MPYLFSYGSNNPTQLRQRLGHSVRGEAAYAPGWERVFRGWSNNWGGGVASLEKKREGITYGFIAKVSAADLRTLDRYEGVGSGNYRRHTIDVVTADGKELEAIAYLSTSCTYNPPTRAYLEAVVKTIGQFWAGDGGRVRVSDIPLRNPSKGFELLWEKVGGSHWQASYPHPVFWAFRVERARPRRFVLTIRMPAAPAPRMVAAQLLRGNTREQYSCRRENRHGLGVVESQLHFSTLEEAQDAAQKFLDQAIPMSLNFIDTAETFSDQDVLFARKLMKALLPDGQVELDRVMSTRAKKNPRETVLSGRNARHVVEAMQRDFPELKFTTRKTKDGLAMKATGPSRFLPNDYDRVLGYWLREYGVGVVGETHYPLKNPASNCYWAINEDTGTVWQLKASSGAEAMIEARRKAGRKEGRYTVVACPTRPNPRGRPARRNPQALYTLLFEHQRGKKGELMGLPGTEELEFARHKDYTGRLEPLQMAKARVGESILQLTRMGNRTNVMVLDSKGNEVDPDVFVDAYRDLTSKGYRVRGNPARQNPAPADVELYQDILAHLRALQWLSWTQHWTSKGPNFYADHKLLQRLYEGKGGGPNINEEIDALGERMVFHFGPAAVEPAAIQHRANVLLHRQGRRAGSKDPMDALLRLESTLQAAIKKAWKANQQSDVSLGLENYLTQLADERDTARYLLKQRLG